MPAIAASAEPMAKVREMVRFTLMPISSAAPRSSDTHRMALPSFVLEVNRVSRTMMTMLTRMVIRVADEMLIFPRCSEVLLIKVVGKDLGLAPQIISAISCSR